MKDDIDKEKIAFLRPLTPPLIKTHQHNLTANEAFMDSSRSCLYCSTHKDTYNLY